MIFSCCRLHHTLHTKSHRNHSLLERYQFECKCQACSNNFPLFEQLSEFDPAFEKFITSDLDVLENFSCYEAKKAIGKYSKYIDENIENYPCYEISFLQECILRCFRAFERINHESLIEGSV